MAAPTQNPEVHDSHDPFTLVERLHQLSEIDDDVTSLISLTNEVLRPLSTPATDLGNDTGKTASISPTFQTDSKETQVAAFKDTMDTILSTLHAIDVRLKRQIWGLEESGIISLKDTKSFGISIEPNGVGYIGGLDVGWLNSRSNKVDRDMETDLWSKMASVVGRLGELEVSTELGSTDAHK